SNRRVRNQGVQDHVHAGVTVRGLFVVVRSCSKCGNPFGTAHEGGKTIEALKAVRRLMRVSKSSVLNLPEIFVDQSVVHLSVIRIEWQLETARFGIGLLCNYDSTDGTNVAPSDLRRPSVNLFRKSADPFAESGIMNNSIRHRESVPV